MRRRSCQLGQSIVEVALVLPVLLLLLAGVVDVARAMATKVALTNASREGARYASRYPADGAGVVRAVRSELASDDIDVARVQITQTPDPSKVPAVSGEQVTVTLVYPFTTIMSGVLGLKGIEITAETTMVVFGVAD